MTDETATPSQSEPRSKRPPIQESPADGSPTLGTHEPPSGALMTWILLLLCLLTVPAALVLKGLLFVASPLLGVVLAVLAMFFARSGAAPSKSGSVIAVGVVLLLVQAGISAHAARLYLRFEKEKEIAEISKKNLRDLNQAMYRYHQAQTPNAYPQTLADLLPDFAEPDLFISPADPNRPEGKPVGAEYTSYFYRPGAGDEWISDDFILLAHEKESWFLKELRMFPEYCRLVLPSDGFAKRLDEADLDQAKKDDRRGRAKEGWPIHEWND